MGQTLTVVALLASVPAVATAGQGDPAWRVVILDSSDPAEPVAQTFGAAIRQAFTARTSRKIDFHSEFMDAMRFHGASYESELVAFLRRKYEGQPPDLVVTVYPDALQFFTRHRERLWPGTPAVFVGVPDDPPIANDRAPGLAGVLTHVDVAGTLDLALHIQPNTRHVVVVSGASDFDRLWKTRAERALAAYAGRLDATYLEGLALADLRDRVARLPDDTIVLYTTVFRDANGPTRPDDVSRDVASASRVPVYGTFEPTLGTGIVGGSLVRLAGEAERAGRLALEIFDGTPPQSIARDVPAPSVKTVDWREMNRFGFNEAALPSGTVVLFRPVPIWWESRGTIIAVIAVVVLQGSLIVSLLVEQRQRRRAELRAHHRNIELAHASRLAAVGEITASIAHQINQPLGAIRANADAAEMLLDADPPALDEVREILVDIRREDERAHEVVGGMRALLQRKEFLVEPLNLNVTVAQVLPLLQGEAHRQGVVLRTELADGLPAVEGDRVHLQQVVLNLVMNGIEAAGAPRRQGRVVVRTSLRDGTDVEVTVADTGGGIPEEDLPRIFESFFTTKDDGLGLGLSIACSLVELHRGRIWAENSPNGGAMFHFVLPGRPSA